LVGRGLQLGSGGIMESRRYPITIEGLERAMRYLSKQQYLWRRGAAVP